MCGIAGILSIEAGASRPDIKPMLLALSHRGPDAEGVYSDEYVSLGHRRLSIIDLSESANQPFVDHTGRYIMVYNGEMYNFEAVRKELEGYPFLTNSDTEVLLAAYIRWGVSCIDRFKGMFAFAIWDKVEKSLIVCRDRLGVKPLYYAVKNGCFMFASEVRSLMATGLLSRKLNREYVPDYLTFQSFGSPGSPVQDVMQIEAGTYIFISNGKITRNRYWDFGGEGTDIDFSDIHAVKGEIRRLLRQSVSQRLVSDVPIGAFLSGGIDSSAVVALMSEVSDRTPVTFNIAFKEEEYDERRYAELIAKKYHTEHKVIELSQTDFLVNLENALNSIDSPSADGVNTYVVSRAIREAGITVALSGVGGDELFAGYPFFSDYIKLRRFTGLFNHTHPIRKVVSSWLHSANNRTQRVASLLSKPKLDISTLYPQFRTVISPRLIKELTKLPWNGQTEVERQLFSRLPALEAMPQLSQVSLAEYLGYTQHTLLKDTDQMSMASSLEVREPFFDHELIDFVLMIPDAIKMPTYPKSLLVESLKPLLPDEIVFRKKQGFLFPWRIWMRNEINGFCESRIKRMAQRDFINGQAMIDRWNRFVKGDKAVGWAELWIFIVLEHWMEKNGIE